MEQVCEKCNKTFTYNKDFYDKMGYDTPKLCPKHAAEKRGRDFQKKQREMIQYTDRVQLDLPSKLIFDASYLKRTDDGREYISCLRFQIGFKDGESMTVYDHRNTDPKELSPLYGEMAKASVRVMKVTHSNRTSYEYMVLNEAEEGKIEATLRARIIADPSSLESIGEASWMYSGAVSDEGKWWCLSLEHG